MSEKAKEIALRLLAQATFKKATQPLYYAKWLHESESPKELIVKRTSFKK